MYITLICGQNYRDDDSGTFQKRALAEYKSDSQRYSRCYAEYDYQRVLELAQKQQQPMHSLGRSEDIAAVLYAAFFYLLAI